VDCLVCAPGLIPRGPSDRVKTDRRDAERLARLLMAGELHRVAVPTVEAEGLRDLVRAREDLRGDLMSARHRVSKLLLRHDIRFGGRERNWTQPHLTWLSTVRFDQPGAQAAFDDYRGAVDALIIRRSELERQIAEQLPLSPWAQTAKRLICLRGIDTLTAAGLCAEIGNFERFAKPSLLSGFLGIVPSEYSSDSKRVQGQITKAGPTHARRLLVEAAHHYRRRPRVGLELAARQAGQDPRVVAVAWRAQRRLHARWAHLATERGKPTGTVAVACARELAAFCWEAATLN
jgi:transposase